MPVRFEPAAPRYRVKHSTTEPLCSLVKLTTVYMREGNSLAVLIQSYLTCDPSAVVEKLGIEVGAGKVIGKEKFAGKAVGYI